MEIIQALNRAQPPRAAKRVSRLVSQEVVSRLRLCVSKVTCHSEAVSPSHARPKSVPPAIRTTSLQNPTRWSLRDGPHTSLLQLSGLPAFPQPCLPLPAPQQSLWPPCCSSAFFLKAFAYAGPAAQNVLSRDPQPLARGRAGQRAHAVQRGRSSSKGNFTPRSP